VGCISSSSQEASPYFRQAELYGLVLALPPPAELNGLLSEPTPPPCDFLGFMPPPSIFSAPPRFFATASFATLESAPE